MARDDVGSTLRGTLSGLLLPAYLPIFFLALAWSALTPAFPQYLTGLGAGVTTIGFVIAMKGIGQVVSDAPGGFLLAAAGIRKITILSYLSAIAANVVLIWSRSVPVITVLTFVSGFSTSILLTTVVATIRMNVPAELRGRALAGVGGALRVGMLIGPVLGGAIAERVGTPTLFILRSVAFAGGMVAFITGTATMVLSTAAPQKRRTPLTAVADVWNDLRGRRRAVLTVGLAILILSILRSSREIILPLWGSHVGFSPGQIGVAMSIGAAFDLLLFFPAGIISDRWGRRTAAGLCLGIFSVGLFAILPAYTYLAFIAAASLIGFGNGFGAGINMTTGADLAPDRSIAEFLGLWRLYGDLGSAGGPILVGALAAAIAIGPAITVTALLGVFGTLVITLIAPETRDLR